MPGVRFDAVIFDNDGLLLDTEQAWTRAERDLFERYGRTFTSDHKRDLLGNAKHVAAAKLEAMLGRPGHGARLIEELDELVMEETLAGVPVRPGALELLSALRETGTPLGLASNSPRVFVERVLTVAGIARERFDTVVTLEDAARPKPAPDIYVEACARLDADPARSAALEDSPPGVASARAAGLFVIAVPYFADHTFEEASMQADSLADPRVARALGLAEAA